jgi:hypothetical protein
MDILMVLSFTILKTKRRKTNIAKKSKQKTKINNLNLSILVSLGKKMKRWSVDMEKGHIDIKLIIRNNHTRGFSVDVWKDWYWNSWWWTDGNASCDCNRELFFYRARGIEIEETECGEGKYSVKISNNKTGEILYDEL